MKVDTSIRPLAVPGDWQWSQAVDHWWCGVVGFGVAAMTTTAATGSPCSMAASRAPAREDPAYPGQHFSSVIDSQA
jgi:hypothetical protein